MWFTVLKTEQLQSGATGLFLPETLNVERRDNCWKRFNDLIERHKGKTTMLSNFYSTDTKSRVQSNH